MWARRFSILVISLFILGGCGGGGKSDDSQKTLSGFAIDGQLSGASVGIDLNSNGSLEPSEVVTTTQSSGEFQFQTDESTSGILLISGGRDTGFDLPFRGTLKSEVPEESTTNLMVTPLTTLLAEGMAESRIKSYFNLGLGLDISHDNPLDHFDLLRAGAKMHSTANLMHRSSSQSLETVYREIASLTHNSFVTETFEDALRILNLPNSSQAVTAINQSLDSLDLATNAAELNSAVKSYLVTGFLESDISGKGFDYILEDRVGHLLFRSDGRVVDSRIEKLNLFQNVSGGYVGTWNVEPGGILKFSGTNYYVAVNGLLSFSSAASYPTTFQLHSLSPGSFKADIRISKPGSEIQSAEMQFTISTKCPQDSYPIFNENQTVQTCSNAALN